jgi:hypothetical protein
VCRLDVQYFGRTPGPNILPEQAANAASMLARSWARISVDAAIAGRLSCFALAVAVPGEGSSKSHRKNAQTAVPSDRPHGIRFAV